MGPVVPELSARSQISSQIFDFIFVCVLYMFVFYRNISKCWPNEGDPFVHVESLGVTIYFQCQRSICWKSIQFLKFGQVPPCCFKFNLIKTSIYMIYFCPICLAMVCNISSPICTLLTQKSKSAVEQCPLGPIQHWTIRLRYTYNMKKRKKAVHHHF